MTTVFQQAAQLIALALGMGFLNEFASIGAFEPVQDLIWKLLMSLAFVYLATRVPSMLGQAGTFRCLAEHALLRHVAPRVVDAIELHGRAHSFHVLVRRVPKDANFPGAPSNRQPPALGLLNSVPPCRLKWSGPSS